MLYAQEKNGFTLIELVITVAVLAILTLGVIPLMQVSVKRQKEEQLRGALREMREAIDQFHREALAGAQYQVNQQGSSPSNPEGGPRPTGQGQGQVNIFGDPRVRVFITDQTIFSTDNPDRFPPDLQTLVEGVDVLPVTAGGLGRRGNLNFSATEAATADSAIPKKKIYLRRIPDDPMTPEDESKGEAEWDFRSCYDSADANSWGGENVFDVHSKSKARALDGTNYRDW
jgi:general secretion pathway protein G